MSTASELYILHSALSEIVSLVFYSVCSFLLTAVVSIIFFVRCLLWSRGTLKLL